MHNILAFDYGLKRIGVAVGSLDTKIATAISTIINKKDGPPRVSERSDAE